MWPQFIRLSQREAAWRRKAGPKPHAATSKKSMSHTSLYVKRLRRPGLVLALLIAAEGGCRDHRIDHSQLENLARRAVIDQFAAEDGLWPKSPAYLPSDLEVERGPAITEDIELWRFWPPIDHTHPYVFAYLGDSIVPAGGFQAPDLFRVAARLRLQHQETISLEDVARKLSLVGDRNGAVKYSFPYRDSSDIAQALNLAWSKSKPLSWPTDTVGRLTEGGWHVIVTLLSQKTRSYNLAWIPQAFLFRFDRDSVLRAWSVRTGEEFSAEDVPVEDLLKPNSDKQRSTARRRMSLSPR